MSKYQVVEKDDYGTDWAPVRYNERALTRFDSEKEAIDIAVEYITDRNVNNALTAGEKLPNIECYMMTEKGCFLGILDGQPWYMTYPKDIVKNGTIKHAKGDIVTDKKNDRLEGKTEVAVRTLPGT